MTKNKLLLCALIVVLAVGNSVCLAATATPPYASIIAFYNYANMQTMNTLQTFDIINMTPWDISIGNTASQTPILTGMTNPDHNLVPSLVPFWLSGFNGSKWKPGQSFSQTFPNTFTVHSKQIPLASLINVWKLATPIKGYAGNTYVSSIVPLVFNSRNGSTASAGGGTTTLNFSATSSNGLAVSYALAGSQQFPATMLSFGDGVNNYGWQTFFEMGGLENQSPQHYLTIQAPAMGTAWKPITKNLATVTQNPGKDGPSPGTIVQSPQYLTASGLVYPNFSAVAGDGGNFDLVVILQAGNYIDMQLLFLAVPSSNNALLRP